MKHKKKIPTHPCTNCPHEREKLVADQTIESMVYERIMTTVDSYYLIGGLKIFFSTTEENKKHEYVKKISDYAYSLQDDNFTVEFVEFERPKLHKGKHFASVSSEIEEQTADTLSTFEE